MICWWFVCLIGGIGQRRVLHGGFIDDFMHDSFKDDTKGVCKGSWVSDYIGFVKAIIDDSRLIHAWIPQRVHCTNKCM